MKVLTGLKITPVAPDTNSVWLTGNTLRYFNNGAWQQVGGNSFRFNMPQTLMAPILNPVSLSPTDIHLNYDILNKSTDEYISTAGFFLIPAATDTNAGAYPAAHYTKVESIPSNLNETLSGINTTLSTKADLVNGVVPASQLPTNVDIIRGTAVGYNSTTGTATGFNDVNGNPVTPDLNVQYFGQTTNLLFIYNPIDSLYHAISGQLALGETSSTAYRGDRGKLAYDHISDTNNPHQTTKSQVGLGNVDNTSDTDKPVSTAQQAALNALQTSFTSALATKQATLVSGTNIKTVGGNSVLGTGDIPFPTVTIPTKLPNPFALTFTGAATGDYDGSAAKTVNIPTYNISQTIQQTAINLPNGTLTSIMQATVTKAGTYEVDFITAMNATASAVLAVLTSNAVFASCTIAVRVNGVTQLSSITQVGRAGTAANNANLFSAKAILTLAVNDIVSIAITANEVGLSIPTNGNTRLIIKG